MTSSSTTADRAVAGGTGRRRWGRSERAVVATTIVLVAVGAVAVGVAVSELRSTPPSGPAACPLTAAAESCWRDRTGVAGWTADDIVAGRSPLVRHDGDLVVDVDGAVVRDVWVEGCIAVKASNVTIEDVLVRSDHGCVGGRTPAAPALISTGEHGGGGVRNLVVRDTEIDGRGTAGDTMAIGQSEYTCLRCDIHGTAKGAKADQQVRLLDSYVHDLAGDGVTHTEPFFFDGGAGGILVEGNWLRANPDLSTAAVALVNDWPGRDVVVRDNYLDGNGAVALVGGAVADKGVAAMTGVVVTGNVLVPLTQPDGPHHAHSFAPAAPGNEWSANTDAATGIEVAAPGTSGSPTG